MDAVAAREQRLTGGFAVPLVLIIDAMSVFAAQLLRDLLDRLVLHMLIWFDTRDLCADGLTKGIVDRAAIQAVTDGTTSVLPS